MARADSAGVARNVWLQSPNPGNANNARNVTAAGAENNNNANNGYAAAADCVNCQIKVGFSRNQCVTLTRSLRHGADDNQRKNGA